MHRNEEEISEEEDESGVFCSGRRYNNLKIGAGKGESRSELEWGIPCAVV